MNRFHLKINPGRERKSNKEPEQLSNDYLASEPNNKISRRDCQVSSPALARIAQSFPKSVEPSVDRIGLVPQNFVGSAETGKEEWRKR
jgi:hypothetical protein